MQIQLVMFKENGDRKEFPIRGKTAVLGRQEDCDIRIPLAEVSRKHAEIMVNDDKINIKDLKSANGTFINNNKITNKDLSAGDHIVIGPVVFTVQIDGLPKDIRPMKTRLQPINSSIHEDDLTADFELESKPNNSRKSKDQADEDALAALNIAGEGSSLAFELDSDFDLDDSKGH